MLFSMAPAASALETVEGSFDYLVDYIRMNGEKTAEGELQIHKFYTGSNNISTALGITYNRRENCLYMIYILDSSSDEPISVVITVEKDSTEYSVFCDNRTSYGEDIGFTSVNPSKYKNSSLKYDFLQYSSNSPEFQKRICTVFDSIIGFAVDDFNVFLLETVGFGLGNFGFTKISSPAPVPELSFFDRIGVFFRIMFNAIKALFTIVS